MATTPATDHHDDIPAMDYPQHDSTYRGFLTLVRLVIVNMAFIMLALYAFIEAHNAVLGVVLLILAVIVPVSMQLMGRRRRAA